jgi:Calcineurin-like phosphoesterase
MALVRRLVLFVTALVGSLVAAPAFGASTAQRIVAVGDLHGDFSAWQDIARGAGLIDRVGHWAGGNAVLVQMGDIADRQPDTLKIIRSLQQLQREAPRKGGRVVVVLGNHEAMNLLGDNRYTTTGEYAAFVDGQSAARRDRVFETNRAKLQAAYKAQNPAITPEQVRARWVADHPLGWVEHKLAWAPSGELGRWATSNPAIVKMDGTLFAHGGISAEYARSSSIQAVNERAARAMAAADENSTGILSDPLGPLWYRGLAGVDGEAQAERAAMNPPSPSLTADQELTQVLAAYGAQRMVIGHTPSLQGIQITLGGRLARIDTGNSRYYGGPLSWLEITGNQMIAHTVPRTP